MGLLWSLVFNLPDTQKVGYQKLAADNKIDVKNDLKRALMNKQAFFPSCIISA